MDKIYRFRMHGCGLGGTGTIPGIGKFSTPGEIYQTTNLKYVELLREYRNDIVEELSDDEVVEVPETEEDRLADLEAALLGKNVKDIILDFPGVYRVGMTKAALVAAILKPAEPDEEE